MSLPNPNYHDILLDPSAAYDSPKEVLSDTSLSVEEKLDVLRAWEEDATALLRAEEENMPPANKQSKAAETLSLVSKLKEQLEHADG